MKTCLVVKFIRTGFVSLGLFLIFGCKKDVPEVMTVSVTEIQTTTASCAGKVYYDGGSPITSKGVCWGFNNLPTIQNQKTIETDDGNDFTSLLSGLSPGKLYYVRAYAVNAVGIGYGNSITFTTKGGAPEGNSCGAMEVTTNSATLFSNVVPNYLSTEVTFEYGTTTSYGSTIIAKESPIAGERSTIYVSADLTGLNPGTLYYCRTRMVNSAGTTYGEGSFFNTLGSVPGVLTITADNIQLSAASLNGIVNANELSTSVSFEYGLTSSYGQTVAAVPNSVSGNSNVNVSASLSGLNPGTTYHYRIIATNILGTSTGSDLTFATLGGSPIIKTISTTGISSYSGILRGIINSNYSPTIVTFEYGNSEEYGQSVVATIDPVSNNTDSLISVSISGLLPEMTYHFRIVATNSYGTSYSTDGIFTTTSTLSDAEGNKYSTILIDNNLWMAENLKATKLNDGSSLLNIFANVKESSATMPWYAYYDGQLSNFEKYGALYNVEAIQTGKICPVGWHIPTKNEFLNLVYYYSYSLNNGGKLKEAGFDNWQYPNTGATNESGFTALPGGYFFFIVSHIDIDIVGYELKSYSIGQYAIFCTTDPYNAFSLQYDSDIYTWNSNNYALGSYAFSVRCLKDQ